MKDQENIDTNQLDGGTYEIIRNRLSDEKDDLQKRIIELNEQRKVVFGSIETKLLSNDRINTTNSCVAKDIASLGNLCIFGYNVHFGLRTDITLSDVFSVYEFTDQRFSPKDLSLLEDDAFIEDFNNLYKYYKNTIFSKFTILNNYLFMVFQLSDSPTDIKVFKWLIKENTLTYVDSRSKNEYQFPRQHEFNWIDTSREMHRYGEHPHISILDKVFVETVGGDLTIKIEDNTNDGKGILSESVEHLDQTLDDGQFRFANLGNLIILEIKPFQEENRYFVYNHKLQQVQKIQSIQDSCILLPDEQGIIFPTGYYLQTGEYHLFDKNIPNIQFSKRIASPNGEDYLYVFYSPTEGFYNLMSYNVISQKISTPIICNGYTLFENGELCYFKSEEEQTKHHILQIWQTPYISGEIMPSEHQDSMLYKIGNKDIVKAMAEVNALITLLNQDDHYTNLYLDISKSSKDIIDSYYWLNEIEAKELNIPLQKINQTANAAIDEFQKVLQLKQSAQKETNELQAASQGIIGQAKAHQFKSIDDYVKVLTELRNLRGRTISAYEIRYIDANILKNLEEENAEHTANVSKQCIDFLLDEKALSPYKERVASIENSIDQIKKAFDTKPILEEANQIGQDLELLIEIVSNLDIEDTSHSTEIIDNISLIFSSLNQVKASISNKKKSLNAVESKADFASQLKLIDQSVINFLDISDTTEKCEEYLTKIAIQIEELEGKFAENEEFIATIIEKREEIIAAFDSKRNLIQEKQNKRIVNLTSSSERILKGITKRAEALKSDTEINAFFATDLMVTKIRNIIEQLKELDDSGNAEEIATSLKSARENTLRKLKDKQDLYEDGDNVIKLGAHKFGVNKQALNLSMITKNDQLMYHLSSTDFYEPVQDAQLLDNRTLWNQEIISENPSVYRGAYLAYRLFNLENPSTLTEYSPEELLQFVQKHSSQSFSEGYTKGVHDVDATNILKTLVNVHQSLGLLKYPANIRALAQFFWHQLNEEDRKEINRQIKVAGQVSAIFPNASHFEYLIEQLDTKISTFATDTGAFEESLAKEATAYLIEELRSDDTFHSSQIAVDILKRFEAYIDKSNAQKTFRDSYNNTKDRTEQIYIVRQWIKAFIQETKAYNFQTYIDEVTSLILLKKDKNHQLISAIPDVQITNLLGTHKTIEEGTFMFNYHEFINLLHRYTTQQVPAFQTFKEAKLTAIERKKKQIKLNEFEPNILTSFVRNKLIDQVYLPIIGDNLAKQLGTVGDGSRTDRMGMLLLISPPGYGKTTLMEYIANRLGLIFIKINGPAIGHEVTTVDPMSANNSAAREELKKLNLAFEMGNNIMLYLDDIQHCHPEFLQKFISLSDGTRKIEGIYNGESKTYNLRGKKFCVIMAGNPYTETGTRFQIPDMLANRSDIYNLGDIIGNTASLFKLSLLENSIISNPVLNQLRNKHFDDIYQLIAHCENKNQELQLKGNHTNQEIQDYIAVLEKVMIIRDTVLKVNETYIKSAGMEDQYRTEPAFKLQGSYRDMNKLVSKVVPIMNDQELQTLLLSHYKSESQTLTSAAEANLLKYKLLTNTITDEERQRWEEIVTTFQKNNRLKGLGSKSEMAVLVSQLEMFTDNLSGIQDAIKDLNS